MSQNTEDILIRTGMDQNSVLNGLRTMKGQFQEFAQTGKLGFLKAKDGAEAFNQTISKLTQQVPLLGTALQAILSPIGAALTGATAIFAYVNKQLDAFHVRMDELQRLGASPIGAVKDSLREATGDLDTMQREFNKWLEGTKSEDTVTKRLNEQIDALKHVVLLNNTRIEQAKALALEQAKAQGKDPAPIEEQFDRAKGVQGLAGARIEHHMRMQALKKINSQAIEAEHGVYRAKDNAIDPARAKDLRELPRQISDLERQKSGYQNSEEFTAAKGRLDAAEQALGDAEKVGRFAPGATRDLAIGELKKKVAEAAEAYAGVKAVVDAYTRSIDKNREALKRQKEAQAAADDELQRAQKNYEGLVGQWNQQSGAVETARRNVETLEAGLPPQAPNKNVKWITPAEAKNREFMKHRDDGLKDFAKESKKIQENFMRRGMVAWDTQKNERADQSPIATGILGILQDMSKVGVRIIIPDE
jgi:hypothetical protein